MSFRLCTWILPVSSAPYKNSVNFLLLFFARDEIQAREPGYVRVKIL